jgi:hypothetical protein
MASYLIGRHEFRTKKALQEHFQALFLRHDPGQVITGPDHEDLLDLTAMHPEADYMIGPGIDHFRVMVDDFGIGRTFTIYWVDGRWTRISYRKCIYGQTSHATQVRGALRTVIAPDIVRWREELFATSGDGRGRVLCPLSGDWLLPHEGQMDHAHPDTFIALSARFLESRGLRYEDVRLVENWNGHVHRPIEDRALAEAFRAWHEGAAKMRFIRTDLNRSLGARAVMRTRLENPSGSSLAFRNMQGSWR